MMDGNQDSRSIVVALHSNTYVISSVKALSARFLLTGSQSSQIGLTDITQDVGGVREGGYVVIGMLGGTN